MAATPSNMVPLGTPMPSFDLPTASGSSRVRCADVKGKPALIMFICNHCPFVKHIRSELARLGRDAQARGVAVVAISSNDIERFPEDAPARMVQEAKLADYTFPYLFDETQSVARAFSAACTPDFFLYDADGTLVYRGQLDDSRPSLVTPVTGRDLRRAIDAVLAGQPPLQPQTPSIGCNIKWKPGNEPVTA